ncbi:MAG: zincin-like metallopeptidase domain-containing protein, partial [Paludibacter sp.]|nr:zincin-like metallopeptidase domain-containing protein [Paludibacter sp.]
MANKVYEIVNQRIIQKIQEAIKGKDVLPWQKPWVYANAPQNYVTGRKYRGVNNLLLDSGEYITWNQLCELQKQSSNLKLKKGCKKEMVVYFNFSEYDKEKLDNNGKAVIEKQRIPFLRYYNVYNINDVEGLESKIQEDSFYHDPIEKAEQIAQHYFDRENIKVIHLKGNKAFYSPMTDSITLPLRSQFPLIENYYSCLFHEAGHSSGASNRLSRNIINTFGDNQYSKEELVAEMTASMLLGYCG